MKKILILFSIFTLLIFFVECTNKSDKIVIDAYALGVNNIYSAEKGNTYVFPVKGIKIEIDTIKNEIFINLKSIGEDKAILKVEEKDLPYFDTESKTIKYQILSYEIRPNGAIMFNVKCDNNKFRCAILDSTFSLQLGDNEDVKRYVFYGNDFAKKYSQSMHEATKKIMDALTE